MMVVRVIVQTLVRQRLAPPIQRDQPTADKVLLTVILLVILGALVLMALDAVRFGWSSVPTWAQAIGALTLLLSVWISFRTLRENSFAAPVVKIQKDRGQTVITTGPYRRVRHPLYAGALIFLVGWASGGVLPPCSFWPSCSASA